MKKICFSEKLVYIYESMWRQKPKQQSQSHRRENIKSHRRQITSTCFISTVVLISFLPSAVIHKEMATKKHEQILGDGAAK